VAAHQAPIGNAQRQREEFISELPVGTLVDKI
jgi:hypothetical protein